MGTLLYDTLEDEEYSKIETQKLSGIFNFRVLENNGKLEI